LREEKLLAGNMPSGNIVAYKESHKKNQLASTAVSLLPNSNCTKKKKTNLAG